MPLQLRLEIRYLRVGLAPSAFGGVAAALRGAPGVVTVAIGLRCPHYALAGAAVFRIPPECVKGPSANFALGKFPEIRMPDLG